MTLAGRLNALEASGLVHIARYEPEVEYIFRHALIQDAAYSLLLEADRVRLHELVGRAMERLYAGRLEGHAALLAYHFERAGDHRRAFDYHRRAGENALASYANREAEGHFRRALELNKVRDKQAPCLDGLGEALARQSRYVEALQVWEQSIERFLEMENYDKAAQLYARSGRAAWLSGSVQKDLRICERGLEAVDHKPMSHGLAMLMHEAGRAYHLSGQQDLAQKYLQRAMDMAEKLKAIDVLADTLTTRSLLHNRLLSDCRRDLERAIKLAESAGLLAIAARAHSNLSGLLSFIQEDYDLVNEHLMRAIELSRQRGVVGEEIANRLYASQVMLNRLEIDHVERNLIDLRLLLSTVPEEVHGGLELDNYQATLDWLYGDLQSAVAQFKRNRLLARQEGNQVSWSHAVGEYLWIQVDAHFWDRTVDLDEMYEFAREALGLKFINPPYVHVLLGIICSQRGKLDAAWSSLQKAQQIIAPDDPLDQAVVDFGRSFLLIGEDRLDDAIAVLEKLIASGAMDIKAEIILVRVRLHLAELYRRRGRPADREAGRRILREVAQYSQSVGAIHYYNIALERLELLRQEMLDQAEDHEQVSREMASAGRVQASFLPQVPLEIPGWELAAVLRPARQTSGDFYDFIPLSDEKLALLVADVADKGAGAALFMTFTRGLLRTYAEAHPDDPARVLHETNQRLLADSSRALFVTLFYGLLRINSGQLVYCNAGHNPPYHVPADQGATLKSLKLTGIPLGVDPDVTWEHRELQLQPGDLLALYTDGLTEAQNESGAYFGEASLEERLRGSRGVGAQVLLETISSDLASFVGTVPQTDDITVMVVRRTEMPA